MKKLLVLALILAASSLYAPAFAGGCGGGGGGCGGGRAAASSGGFDCTNPCPLAQAANECRSIGTESSACSAAVRATVAANVMRNLSKM